MNGINLIYHITKTLNNYEELLKTNESSKA